MITFERHPDEYRHWELAFDGAIEPERDLVSAVFVELHAIAAVEDGVDRRRRMVGEVAQSSTRLPGRGHQVRDASGAQGEADQLADEGRLAGARRPAEHGDGPLRPGGEEVVELLDHAPLAERELDAGDRAPRPPLSPDEQSHRHAGELPCPMIILLGEEALAKTVRRPADRPPAPR